MCVSLRVCSFPVTMAVEKRLAFSVVQFLRDQIHCAALNSDEQESLEGGSVPPLSTLRTNTSLSFKSYNINRTRVDVVCFFSFINHTLPWVSPVAIQCLETTFKISSSDCHLAAPQPLKEIFLNSLLKVGSPELRSTLKWALSPPS